MATARLLNPELNGEFTLLPRLRRYVQEYYQLGSTVATVPGRLVQASRIVSELDTLRTSIARSAHSEADRARNTIQGAAEILRDLASELL